MAKLRMLEDQWTWDTTKYELAVMALREQVEAMADRLYVGHVHQEQWRISWGYGAGSLSINMDEVGCANIIRMWKAGEFNND